MSATAKLFMHGRSQAVRLPKEFRLEMLCLDTNIVISVINERPASIRTRLEAELASGVTIGIPAIVLFEMRYGAAKNDRRARSEAGLEAFLSLAVTPWSFETEDAMHAGAPDLKQPARRSAIMTI